MTDPIFILGCHRSGTSVVAGLLAEAGGVSMGELMPATIDNPMGYYESQGVVDAHRDLLFQMERDWTCPPEGFRPGVMDLTRLEEQVELHRRLPRPWAVKDPRSMFLLDAWAHLGIRRARLVAVVRAPADTVRSIEKRDGIREDRAEAIVDTYMSRLADIARVARLPVVHFSSDGAEVLRQVRALASSLDLGWDDEAAQAFFDPGLVRNRSPLQETTPALDELMRLAFPHEGESVPSTDLRTLKFEATTTAPPWQPDHHLAVRYARQRHELWDFAEFTTAPDPVVVELLLEGARLGGGHRPGVKQLHQIEVSSPLTAGALILREGHRPHGVIAHGLLRQRTRTEIEFFFRSMYVNTHVFAELVVDVPAPNGSALLNVVPKPSATPRPALVLEVAGECGWDHVATQRVSPGRVGIAFRKRVTTDSELVPVVTDLIASLDRIHSIDTELAEVKQRLRRVEKSGRQEEPDRDRALRSMTRRAEAAERDLRRLRGRRSVRIALSASRPFRPLFRRVRSWKNAR